MGKIKELKNWEAENCWNEHYRFIVGAKVAYEIIVLYHDKATPLLTAKANLYITGLWHTKEGNSVLERECLANELPVQELLKIAYDDYKKNL